MQEALTEDDLLKKANTIYESEKDWFLGKNGVGLFSCGFVNGWQCAENHKEARPVTQPTSQLNQASETMESLSTGQKDEPQLMTDWEINTCDRCDIIESAHRTDLNKLIIAEKELAQAKQSLRIAHEAYIDETHTLRERIKELEGAVARVEEFANKEIAINDCYRNALEKIAKPTYGTEFIAHDLEEYKSNYEIICRHYFAAQKLAREALGKDGGG